VNKNPIPPKNYNCYSADKNEGEICVERTADTEGKCRGHSRINYAQQKGMCTINSGDHVTRIAKEKWIVV
jgi:hypothetical protein